MQVTFHYCFQILIKMIQSFDVLDLEAADYFPLPSTGLWKYTGFHQARLYIPMKPPATRLWLRILRRKKYRIFF